MPRTIEVTNFEVARRVAIRLPGRMMAAVDRIVTEHPEFNYNRQQFVESAVREKIERMVMMDSVKSSGAFITVNNRLRPLYR
jgi:metal-responsive CopG/Arc/MetJ family transcriptional regulator